MTPTRICALPDHILQSAVCAWPDKDVTWTLVALIPGVSEEAMHEAVSWGFSQWEKVCGIKARYIETARTARVLVGSRRIDGSGRILAECELPCGMDQVRLWFDVGEQWLTDMSSRERGIILHDVAWHELGHALGLGHAPQGSNNVMAPVYNPAVDNAGSWDRAESTMRYGPPIPVVVPPPVIPTPIPSPGGNPVDFKTVFGLLISLLSQPWFQEFLTKLASKPSLRADGSGPTLEEFQAALNEYQRAA